MLAIEPLAGPGAIDAIDAIDDPDEATLADHVAADDEPTTLRPTPVPIHLKLSEEEPRPAKGQIGKYELYSRIARGAFGVIYSARDPSLERNVALKVLRPSHHANHEVMQRFLQEARTAARIAHPGVVTIHDCGMVETRRGPTAFIAMELLAGESLTSRLTRVGRVSTREACELVRQVASALEAAHHADVLHRDLKPDNIFLVPDPAMPSGERIKVLDFGLAKLGSHGQTQLQSVFGTPRYISPEQSRSATQIDHRSDIYSLGCVLFELVTGQTPFDGDVRQLVDCHQRAAPPRAASLAPDVPAVLDELIADMLAKDPIDRPQTMGAVQRALRFAAECPPPGSVDNEITERPAFATLPGPGTPSASASMTRPPTAPHAMHPAPPGRPPRPSTPPDAAATLNAAARHLHRPSTPPDGAPGLGSEGHPPRLPTPPDAVASLGSSRHPQRPPTPPGGDLGARVGPPNRSSTPPTPPDRAASLGSGVRPPGARRKRHLASVEIAITPTPARPPDQLFDSGAISGEIVVPALQPPAPPIPALPVTPTRFPVAPLPAVRGPVIPVMLGLLVLAVLTIIALVAFF